MFKFTNQTHAVHRSHNPLEKIASVYDKQRVSNRVQVKEPLTFSKLARYEAEVILEKMNEEAGRLNKKAQTLEKEATVISTPFEAFGQAKHHISSKLGVTSEVAHDLASSVVARAQDLIGTHGGKLSDAIAGIVEQLSPEQVKSKLGAVPMRPKSNQEIEETIKEMLVTSLGMSAYQADQIKKTVMTQARNFLTTHRLNSLEEIAVAIVNVLIEHQDPSVVYGISTSPRLREEVAFQLKGHSV